MNVDRIRGWSPQRPGCSLSPPQRRGFLVSLLKDEVTDVLAKLD
jgi:hypothetical protein